MKYIVFYRKNYFDNYILTFFLFINTLIYTVIVSLIFWNSLVMVKAIVIKCIILILHRFRVFHYTFFFIVAVYNFCYNYTLGSGGADVGDTGTDKNKEKEQDVPDWVLAVAGGIIMAGIGFKCLDHFYPEMITAMKTTLWTVGTGLITYLGNFSFSLSASEGGGLEKASIDSEATRDPNSRVIFLYERKAFQVCQCILDLGVKLENYNFTVTLLRMNNVSPKLLSSKEAIADEIFKSFKNSIEIKSTQPLYSSNLSPRDLDFYDILVQIDPK